MRSSSKQLTIMKDMVVESNKTFIDVFLNAVDAGHVEGGQVLNRPVPLLKQLSAMHVSRRLTLGVVEDSIELTVGHEIKTKIDPQE